MKTEPGIETQNRTIAEFMKLELVKSEVDWHDPYYIGTPDGEVDFKDLKYHTDFNWFVPAWNKAVAAFDTFRPGPKTPKKEWNLWHKMNFEMIGNPEFLIQSRMPILLKVIEFLNRNTEKGEK